MSAHKFITMRPVYNVRHNEPEPEVIGIPSDSEDDDPEDDEPEVIVISSDSEQANDEDLAVLEDVAMEDGEIEEVPDIPTVGNQVRRGYWQNGYWRTPGNPRNYHRDEGGIWSLNEPPMDGVEGGLARGWKQDLFKETLGGLLYTQWLQNKDKHVTLGGSMYNAWLDASN